MFEARKIDADNFIERMEAGDERALSASSDSRRPRPRRRAINGILQRISFGHISGVLSDPNHPPKSHGVKKAAETD